MSKLSYRDYSQFYASQCDRCNGKKKVMHKNVWTMCICQHTANMKWRFEQFEVSPPDLKYKSWDDFKGVNATGDDKLTVGTFISAREKALEYCFGSSDPTVLKDRKKYLIIHKRLRDGKNLIIVGGAKTGKTLIAALIVKEVAYACRIHNIDLTFKCIKSVVLQDAARWDRDKSVNHDLLDELSDIDFLIIDGIEKPIQGGHKDSPPDAISMDNLFYSRTVQRKPTIIICSGEFWSCATTPQYKRETLSRWGDEFSSVLLNPKNTVIKLEKESYA